MENIVDMNIIKKRINEYNEYLKNDVKIIILDEKITNEEWELIKTNLCSILNAVNMVKERSSLSAYHACTLELIDLINKCNSQTNKIKYQLDKKYIDFINNKEYEIFLEKVKAYENERKEQEKIKYNYIIKPYY